MFTKKVSKKKKKQEEKLGTKTRTQQRNAAVCTSVTLNAPDTADCADTCTRSMEKKHTLMIKTTTLNGELH